MNNPSPFTCATTEPESLTSRPSSNSFESMSEITLDSRLDSEASIQTENTQSPVFFDHNDIESNFISINAKSNRNLRSLIETPSQISFSSPIEDDSPITISEISRKTSVQTLFPLSPNRSVPKFKPVDMLEFLENIKCSSVDKSITHQKPQEISSNPSQSAPLYHPSRKVLFGLSLASMISGTILLIINEKTKRDEPDSLILPGILLISLGGLSSFGIAWHYHMIQEQTHRLNEECTNRLNF